MHTNFFETGGGGYVIGYQHIFWFYSHPAVYIMMLPGFGIISEIISVMSRKPIFGYRLMALSLLAILVLGFSVWAHHMFVAGMAALAARADHGDDAADRGADRDQDLLLAGDALGGQASTSRRPCCGRSASSPMFTIGGLSGIYLGSVPIDIHASDTYFIVAHIHYVLFGGSMFTIFAGIYYWFPKMTGRMYNERLGQLHFWLTFIAFNLTFFPMHYIGLQGMPRRVADYADRFADINLFISIASFGLGASTLIFLYNMIWSWSHGPTAGDNPWRAMTLEWQVELAAADLQLRRDPAGRRRPVRVRRPGRPPRHLRRAANPRRYRPSTEGREQRCHERAQQTHTAATTAGMGYDYPPPIHYSSRISPPIVGIFLFIGSEIMLFGSFFTVYFFVRVVNQRVARGRRAGRIERPWFLALINTLILVTSSFTMHWATTSIKRGNRAGLCAGHGADAPARPTFLLTQVIEYHRIGFNTGDTAFAADVLRAHGPPRLPRLRRPHDPARDDDPLVPRPLQPRAPPRRRDRRDLLALRRRDVDRRLRRPSTFSRLADDAQTRSAARRRRSGSCCWRSATVALIVVASLINVLARARRLHRRVVGSSSGGVLPRRSAEAPVRQAPPPHPPGERRILVVANETVGGRALLDEIREPCRRQGHAECSSSCPALNTPLKHWTSDEDAARAAAQARLEASLAAMRGGGHRRERRASATAIPLQAIEDALRTFAPGRADHLDAPRGPLELARARRRRPAPASGSRCRSRTSSSTSRPSAAPTGYSARS